MDFKIYLTRQGVKGSKKEIRRFIADYDAIINFTYFSEKLYTIFPNLRGKRFEVSWKDDDNDDVLISSNEELQIALLEMQNLMMKKLYVIVYSEHDNAFHNNSSCRDYLHRGVTCDGCEKSVYGYRYKCIQCLDYDLCSDCEAKLLHPEHYMIRISSVQDSMYGKQLGHYFHKFMKIANSNGNLRKNCSAKDYSKVQTSCNWETLLPSMINFFTNETVSDQCPAMAKEKQKNNTSQSQSSPNEEPSNSTSKNTSEDKRLEFLKYLGANVSQFLDPLGIDFSLQVKPPETATEAEEASASESHPEKANDKPCCSKSESQNETFKDLNKPVEKENQKSNILTKNDTPISRSPEREKELSYSKSESQNENFNDLNKSVEKENQKSNILTTNVTSISKSPEREKESPLSSTENWILIDKDENLTTKDFPVNASDHSNPVTESNTNNSTKKVLYPLLPNVSDNIWHRNPLIQDAVETMMEMGFSNEGGRLTQLLLSKNGDISKVIDILQPINL